MISQITPQVAIGNADDARTVTKEQFDAVLNVAIDLEILDLSVKRHKIGLIDGPGNDPMTFLLAVLFLYSLVKSGKRVLIHCHEGKSRSVMVCAIFVAIQEQISVDEALAKIMPARKVDVKRPALYELAQTTKLLATEIILKMYV
jgi:protein-tyrosine phosphatase